jgi:hypothetical protein
LSKDYELKVQTSEAFIDLATIRLMLKRLAPRSYPKTGVLALLMLSYMNADA